MESQNRQRRVRFTLPEHGTISYRNGTVTDPRINKSEPPLAPKRPPPLTQSEILKNLKNGHFVIVNEPPKRFSRQQKMHDSEKICKGFFRIRLFDEVFRRTRSLTAEEEQKLRQQSVLAASTEKSDPTNLYDANNARIIISDLVQRWHKVRNRDQATEQTRYVAPSRLTAAAQENKSMVTNTNRMASTRFEMPPHATVRKLKPQVRIVERKKKLLTPPSSSTSPRSKQRIQTTATHLPVPINPASVLTSIPVTVTATPSHRIVSFRNRMKSDVNRFSCVKMTLEQEQPVTTLLRAARESDEELLTIVLRKILVDGISKEALNSTDKCGRTAISYICSTGLANFLDILLQIPGIDVNKPDNEGNTPLHFAAQAGQADILNMLITRSRSLQVDAKNNLGFTPLMKAALQGRTQCAKLLLFAGASPLATDSGRGLRAEQWARFCGRKSCAEMIEKCARARLLEKNRSAVEAQNKNSIVRSKTYGDASEGLRSKFRKVFPFNFSLKEKSHKSRESSNPNLVSYLTSATLCASGPALPTQENSQVMSTLMRPLEVPKLEVTPANNASLIKKYETSLNRSESKKAIASSR